jgi:hypothetical protein
LELGIADFVEIDRNGKKLEIREIEEIREIGASTD